MKPHDVDSEEGIMIIKVSQQHALFHSHSFLHTRVFEIAFSFKLIKFISFFFYWPTFLLSELASSVDWIAGIVCSNGIQIDIVIF